MKRAIPAIVLACLLGAATNAGAQAAQPDPKPSLTVYGFAMLDIGHDFKQIDPAWFDTMRVTKLPKFPNQFGLDHNTFAGIRQTRFGVKSSSGTSMGELKTTFEFELFGVGVDEGQTTIRMRHAYGELGRFGAGQTWSVFMDPDVFPNQLEYWGPTGMVFFRNVQVRFMPIQGDTHATIALERPGSSGDQGVYEDRIELDGIKGRNPMFDLTGEYTRAIKQGYVRVAGILRNITWDDVQEDEFELGDSVIGWGINLSSNIKFKTDVLRLQFAFGEGIENYMNDAPVDVGIEANPGDATRPFKGQPLPLTALVLAIDHNWNSKWASTFGYSYTDIDNTEGQAPDAFRNAQYATGNILYMPVPNVMGGMELQYGKRTDKGDFSSTGVKLQFSFKYNFSMKIGG
jgi:hypothetical protein